MLNRLLFLLTLTLLASCGRQHDEATALLDRADSLMTVCADSAYTLLADVQDETRASWRRADRMRYELTLAEAMNKAYKDFTTDSVMKRVARYYDRHGSANQQLKAHYLLGCAYRDMGEAPMAINAYQEAVEKADTLSKDCDYKTLSCVYSQISDIFHDQLTLSNAIQCRHRSIEYSYRSGDTLTALYDYTRMAADYILLGVNDSAEKVLLKARDSYIQYGREKDWALFSSPLIYLYLRVPGHLSDVKELLDAYEKNSGISRGDSTNIPNIRSYYKFKGQYYEQTGQLDSAEFFFRKLQQKSLNFMQKDPLFRGLAKVFSKKHMTDSVAKYVFLYGEANDSSIAIKDREIMAKMSAQFNYSRLQKNALQKELEAEKSKRKMIASVFIAIILGIVAFSLFITFRKHVEQVKKERLQSRNKYLQAIQRHNEIKEHLQFIVKTKEKHIQELIKETYLYSNQIETKDESYRQALQKISDTEKYYESHISSLKADINKLNIQIESLKSHGDIRNDRETSQKLFSSEIVKSFYEYARKSKLTIQDKDWIDLTKAFEEYYPNLLCDLRICEHIHRREIQICMLTILAIHPGDIARFLDIKKNHLTNIKSKINQALFKDSSAATLLDNLCLRYGILN